MSSSFTLDNRISNPAAAATVPKLSDSMYRNQQCFSAPLAHNSALMSLPTRAPKKKRIQCSFIRPFRLSLAHMDGSLFSVPFSKIRPQLFFYSFRHASGHGCRTVFDIFAPSPPRQSKPTHYPSTTLLASDGR